MKKEYDIYEYIEYEKYNINKNDGLLTINLTGLNYINNAESMFFECILLQSLPDISKWDTKNVTNMRGMFNGCPFLNIPSKFKYH